MGLALRGRPEPPETQGFSGPPLDALDRAAISHFVRVFQAKFAAEGWDAQRRDW